jgi:hypothetical protein
MHSEVQKCDIIYTYNYILVRIYIYTHIRQKFLYRKILKQFFLYRHVLKCRGRWEAYSYGQLFESQIKINTEEFYNRMTVHRNRFLVNKTTLVTLYLLELFQHKMYQSRCKAKNSWWWAERLPETCRVVIPIKLEFSASVGLIHRKYRRTYIEYRSLNTDLS